MLTNCDKTVRFQPTSQARGNSLQKNMQNQPGSRWIEVKSKLYSPNLLENKKNQNPLLDEKEKVTRYKMLLLSRLSSGFLPQNGGHESAITLVTSQKHEPVGQTGGFFPE
ncbi:hypothetical protein AVEN_86314-1 [Araneus ventricosus]|uniref:Uncharacterized protein n=1 Tax=Araneus ventricosus TaxID=182803 RepID=A0A4Y2PJG8_ARAVE|nr:hypothetical protein AVEN_86314-1 [Araneus ventricosus]